MNKNRVKVERRIEEILKIAKQEQMPPLHTNTHLCCKCAYFGF
ncbi:MULTISPECIES: Dna2/Cas4 domain-containing protein [unclassified Thermoactinomyces]|uniref:Dna2/Cas4 domain-containing protein n=1 Tax=Thermoactinomyces daqus TaxID=1329516 RepID=A0A7W1XC34_9BACL|nr:Dna2/Cas4 domain-containing protein [Thermoactinomyces daqus]MBH8599354.1 Dna2/Cas4 domain-containing protein [Thermoactinomyces sp. CICC 10523]MBH8608324.1 Dna2/Cas4 domain-containing protein [Thermoactinomyces sp. CICC 10521]